MLTETTIAQPIVSSYPLPTSMMHSQDIDCNTDLPIAVNLSKCEKTLCSLYKNKKAHHGSFCEDE